MKSNSIIFLIFLCHTAFSQTIDSLEIRRIDQYVENIEYHKDKMGQSISEGEIYDEQSKIIGGHETYYYSDKLSNDLLYIEHNESREIYTTEHYYFKHDTLVFVEFKNPTIASQLPAGKYYIVGNSECYLSSKKEKLNTTNCRAIIKSAITYLNDYNKNKIKR